MADPTTDEPLRWLLTAEAEAALADVGDATATPALVAKLRKRLGGDNSARRAAAILELADLRRRAIAKFEHADRMFFTRKSFEQATDEWIARHKARSFASFDRVADVCCGVGGDLIGLARVVNHVVGLDADDVLCEYAARNAAMYADAARFDVRRETVADLPDCDAWHADPDRRPAGNRTTRPELHEPSLETLAAWRRRQPNASVKLAPAACLPEDWRAEAELEWISRGGECRQLVAWTGSLATHAGQGRATRVTVGSDGEVGSATFVGHREQATPAASQCAQWLYEPDPAVLAARLDGALAEELGLGAVAPGVAYWTSDRSVGHPLLARFQVTDRMPFDRKRLAGWLAERHVGRLEVKCRGVDIGPARLRRELKPGGDNEATLLLFADERRRVTVVVARRESG